MIKPIFISWRYEPRSNESTPTGKRAGIQDLSVRFLRMRIHHGIGRVLWNLFNESRMVYKRHVCYGRSAGKDRISNITFCQVNYMVIFLIINWMVLRFTNWLEKGCQNICLEAYATTTYACSIYHNLFVLDNL